MTSQVIEGFFWCLKMTLSELKMPPKIDKADKAVLSDKVVLST